MDYNPTDPPAYGSERDRHARLPYSYSDSDVPSLAREDAYDEREMQRPERPWSPSGYSAFSMTSTLERRVFRVDDGRLYQATNDDYAFPADDLELARLDQQHYGVKILQGEKNYLAPIAEFLGGDGSKRGIDIGTGTGIWTIEMAQEFPHVEWTGVDLIPVEPDRDVPDNVQFVQDDITKGLGFPDKYFDLVHARFLLLGVRDWDFVIAEATRILRPGGLLVWVDIGLPWRVAGANSDEEARRAAPGYTRILDYVTLAAQKRGLDIDAGEMVAERMRRTGVLTNVHQIVVDVPLWPWSDDPVLRRVGNIMLQDTREMPHSARLMVIDGCQITDEDYQVLVQGYMADIGRPGANMVMPAWHNWAWRIEQS